jgi:hypothetical protein
VPGLSPNAVLKEDWDGLNINSVWTLTNNGGTAANITNIGGANGNVLRITNLNGGNNNSIAWDYSDYAADEVVISFLVSMSDDAANAGAGGCCGQAADGFGFGLFDTAVYGTTGPNNPAAAGSQWEDPRGGNGFPDAIMIGFDIFDSGDGEGNHIRVSGLGGPADILLNTAAPFELNNGLFHKVITRLVADGGGSLLSMDIIEDVNGTAIEHNFIIDAPIPGIDLNTFQGRMIAGGRTGGAFVETLLDCVQIESFAGQPLRMTDIVYDQENDQFTLSWTANEGKTYALFFEELLAGKFGDSDITDGIQAVAPNPDQLAVFADGVLTYGPFDNPVPGATKLFFKAQQE